MNHQESLTSYISAFVAELVNCGVKDVVVSPGSRSTPIAMVMAEHKDLHVHIHVDERSAAFFALGIAKVTHKPVAILCTSGTATANYYPAIVEAHYSRVPLIVLTADRPHELRDVGAPQAIDQIHLYGQHVKWFVEMAPPEGTIEMVRYARNTCARAAAVALQSPAGPVHLNFPLREPLIPDLDREDLFTFKDRTERYVQIEKTKYGLNEQQIEYYAKLFDQYEKGIIVCGSMNESGQFPEKVISLSEKLNYPIIADPLSQLRSGKHSGKNIIDTYDTFLRNEDAKLALKPNIVIRFGAMPVSKALTIFIKESLEARQVVIDGGGGWQDPSLLSTDMVYCDEEDFCQSISDHLSSANNNQVDYLQKWQEINTLTKDHLTKINDITELNEGKVFYKLAEMLPDGATLFVGNSMPIRDLDSFFFHNNKSIRILANRGANGIDGTVSTALGAALESQPLYLVLGDLTFFHDLNGLIASKLYNINIKIILINNNGGGIFSFLPQSNHPKNFELLFGTPLDLDFKHSVTMFNGIFDRITDWDHFSTSLLQKLGNHGLHVLEIPTNRDENLQVHRNLWKNVSWEISRILTGEKE
ncbi:2-succinyl-5-enolpyruvyl-6-hydroxy-3-cyclohexene-1-carboxylic-acid synthase [Bacillus massilinigeriensis]|uniref:2-succinyl-5-enolpyruvyl-6-hydroxy-3- cyclohexene-1-carboxylic-acid synthase n=1 Tax=Bacillus massilionigeriensis TaxID=1805475 RepID=UPI00096AF18F|nr:2-succinyl-5-enolpyruvyl-6-hydroxy-3-cyclohexene-1-carboxylic-acid synthase [Bacillus massilionigeriensis]